jgi:hypothetical protein
LGEEKTFAVKRDMDGLFSDEMDGLFSDEILQNHTEIKQEFWSVTVIQH